MDQDIKLADATTPYILFQRTVYQRLPSQRIHNVINKVVPIQIPIYNTLVKAEAKIRPEQIKKLYVASMQREYALIREYLPATCRASLDIGCGISGIDVLLARHYQEQTPHIFLLDKSQVEKNVYYLFEKKGGFYNSLAMARQTLIDNGVAPDHVHTIEANDASDIPITQPLDLVVSLISWGFHYPLETYLAHVRALLSDDGVLIVDVRKNTGGLEMLKQQFSRVEIIQEAAKRHRVVAQK